MMTLILTFSLREKEPEFDPRVVRRNSLREKEPEFDPRVVRRNSLREKEPDFDAAVVRRNSLSLRERVRVRVTSVAMNPMVDRALRRAMFICRGCPAILCHRAPERSIRLCAF